MFKYSTSTILNGYSGTTGNLTNEIAATTFVDELGNPRITATAKNTNVVGKLHITRLGKFDSESVSKIYYRESTVGSAGKAEITCDTSTAGSKGVATGVYRLKLYVKLSGSNNANYSNDFVFKGKPYVYEFNVTSDTATAVATAAEEAINKAYKRFGDKIFKVTRDGAALTIEVTGKDKEYISVTECELQKFDDTVNSPLIGGEYVPVVTCSVTDDTNKLHACVNPFGTYGEVIKDLRLPTPEHTGWTSIMSDEMPSINGKYDQYIIYMCKDRGIMGGDAVGQPAKSVTAHSIWVPSANSAAFKALLTDTLMAPVKYNTEYTTAKGADGKAGTADDVPGVSGEIDVVG